MSAILEKIIELIAEGLSNREKPDFKRRPGLRFLL